ncbi:MAG: ArsR/SmtB family transcription factor [Acidimicrobiales bacterium]
MSTTMLNEQLRLQLDELVTSMCKAINDPKRLMLLYALRDEPQTVGELCRAVGTAQSNTSQHLAVLRDRGLVSTERQGNSVIYALRHPRVLDAIDILRDVMSDEVERQQELRSPSARKRRGVLTTLIASRSED